MRTPTLEATPDAGKSLSILTSDTENNIDEVTDVQTWATRHGEEPRKYPAGTRRGAEPQWLYVWGALPAPRRTPSASLLALNTCSAVACWTATDTITLYLLIILAFSSWGNCEHATVAHAKASRPHLPLQSITKG